MICVLACNDSQARTSPPATAATSQVVADSESSQAPHTIRLEQVGGQFRNPVYLSTPAGDPRLFVVEQAGRIRVVKNGLAVPAPFLDIAERVKSGGEQGLLSVAFHPQYRNNGYFFVNFTDRDGDTRVERFKVSSNPDVADVSSSKLVVEVDQPYSNHNGGHVVFAPDGKLWIGMGDGGSGGDPRGNGQNRQSLLGKMLRVDVNREDARPQIWAIGLRNPWRFAFDRPTGLVYIADVGQSEQEEIHIAPANRDGLNYGWNIMEGDECYRRDNCNRDGLQIPQVTYKHLGSACSITGGFVYRGRAIPSIAGHYFYSDYCAGWLKSFRFIDGRVTDRRDWTMNDIGNVVSFGEDANGEMYVIAEGGRVFRFARAE
jgi:glucose/arabinose dehydrogenase